MRRPEWRHYLTAGAVLVAVALLLAALVVFSGIYDISARRDHFAVVTRLLEIIRRESVDTQSTGIEVPPLAAPELARLGARYYDAGCAPCHGAPGRPASAVAGAMLPVPPRLEEAVGRLDDAALFWIVRNGLKFTGMPAWLAPARSDEVWPLVAFLRRYPELDAQRYAALAGLAAPPLAPPAAPLALAGESDPLARCIACHGEASGSPVSPLVPRLGGLSADYLARSLRDYAAGRRESGMMQLFATPLGEAEIAALAAYYAAGEGDLVPLLPARGDAGRGAAIFLQGLPGQDVPACAACHSGAAARRFAPLGGQPADYLVQQLLNWQRGLRARTPEGRLMAAIALRLEPQQIEDVAAYLQAQPAETVP